MSPVSVEYGWVPTRSGALFSAFHRAQQARGTAVVLVAPFGWEATTSARSLRAWARELAAAGCSTARFHAPGAGDSEGDSRSQDLGTWTEALIDVLAHTRAASGCTRLAVIGLGLGGLVAASAVNAGADVDDLVLWATPVKGRLLLRELRAFAAMTIEPEAEAVPATTDEDGALWVHGYPVGAVAQEQLTAMDLTSLDLSRVKRALVLGRGTLPPDAKVVTALQAAGAEVTAAPGPGYDQLTADTRFSALPDEVVSTVDAWLLPDGPAGSGTPWPVTEVAEHHYLDGPMAGVVHPVPGAELTAVFMGTVATPRSGPNRLWTEAAHRWAQLGIASVRVDMNGNGEADGADTWPRGLESFYGDEYRAQVVASLDAAVTHGLPDRFFLTGLCSGGYWAAQIGLVDPRVRAVAMLNIAALVWPPPLTRLGARGRLRHVTSKEAWLPLLTDPVRRRDNLGSIKRSLQLKLAGRGLGDTDRAPATSAQVLLALEAAGVQVTIGMSPGEALTAQLTQVPDSRHRRLVLLRGPRGAHTLSPPELRRQAVDLVDDAARAALAGVRT